MTLPPAPVLNSPIARQVIASWAPDPTETGVVLPDADPDGAALLDEARALLVTYCALPNADAADAIILWCAATHALPALPFAPRLVVRSATKRSGKSRVLEVVAALCHRPLKTINATVPAVFRSLKGEHPPTLIFDEVDTIFGSKKVAEQNEDLRGLLNAGFERGSPSLRCVGPMQVPTEFPSFAMCALAGIGRLPDTIEDRSVIIHMRRRKPSEIVKPFRIRRDRPALEEVGEQLGQWLNDPEALAVLGAAEPVSDLEDRAADVWEPLLAVADLAGGDWPTRARNAAKVLVAEAVEGEGETSLPVQLLHDLRDAFEVFRGDFVPSHVITSHLVMSIPDSPWGELPLNPHRLGRMLSDFGIRSRHNPERTKRGYWRADFTDAWDRYPAVQASKVSGSVHTLHEQAKQPDALMDASEDPSKASIKASTDYPSSGDTWTLLDTSDAYMAEKGAP